MTATDLLTAAGFETVCAESADEALRMLRRPHRINVLITDIDLPGEANGFGVAWCAHSFGMKIVVMSGRVVPSDELLPPGATFLQKPVDDQKLLALLRRQISEQAPDEHASEVLDFRDAGGGA
jgi:two-component system, response regulator PdtaR